MVGAFYPFSRNHNNWGQKAQEPYQDWFINQPYEGTTTYYDIMQRAINIKYSMIRYYYTYLHNIHKEGGTLYKPLFFEFPDDAKAYEDQPYNIMLGKAMKLGINSNVLGQDETTFLFPKGTWCDLFNVTIPCTVNEGDASIEQLLPSKAYNFHLHLREGYIVPMQDVVAMNNESFTIKTSADLQKQPVDFHILGAVDASKQGAFKATGDYINDDGISTKGSKLNGYTLNFFQDPSADVDASFQIELYEQAEDFKDQGYKVNGNDDLATLYIYDAETKGMNKDYTVAIKTKDGTNCGDKIPAATYDASSNRVIWTADKTALDEKCILLPNIQEITFTAAA